MNLLRTLRISRDALWSYECPCGIHGLNESHFLIISHSFWSDLHRWYSYLFINGRGTSWTSMDNSFYFSGTQVLCQVFIMRILVMGSALSWPCFCGGVFVNTSKIKAVTDWEHLKSVFEILCFLELAGYYHRFVPNFLHPAAPLTRLTRA